MMLLPPLNNICSKSEQTRLEKPELFLDQSKRELHKEPEYSCEVNGESSIDKHQTSMIKPKSQTSDHSETSCPDQEEPESIGNLIKNEVIPQWNQYMSIKNLRKEADPSIKPRADTFKKKILRDLREFYRILFRKRFHLSEYKTIEGISK